MQSELITAVAVALMGGGLLTGVATLYRARNDKPTTVVSAADQAVNAMGRALEAMEARALAAEKARDEALQKFDELEQRFEHVRAALNDALEDLAEYRKAAQLGQDVSKEVR